MKAVELGPAKSSPSGPVLVATKLHLPAPRSGPVPRRELLAQLVSGRERRLTLVCAPAGWGKSTLLSEWFASPEERRPFAWLSLDSAARDPVRFWSDVIGALRSIHPELGGAALAALPSAGPDLVDVVVVPLINELAELDEPLVLVLDDYHVVRSEAIHASLEFLLRRGPGTLHLAIASRADPPFAIGGLRAAGHGTEIRAAPASMRTSSSTYSIASSAARSRAATRAPASAWRSRARSPRRAAAVSTLATRGAAERCSRSACRSSPRPRRPAARTGRRLAASPA